MERKKKLKIYYALSLGPLSSQTGPVSEPLKQQCECRVLLRFLNQRSPSQSVQVGSFRPPPGLALTPLLLSAQTLTSHIRALERQHKQIHRRLPFRPVTVSSEASIEENAATDQLNLYHRL